VRGNLSGNPSLREVIKRIREAALGAYTHQDVPFEKLVEELRPERSLSRSPLFQVMFVLQDDSQAELTISGLTVNAMPAEAGSAKFDLALGVVETGKGLDVWLNYSTELFDPASVASMLEDFTLVLESLVEDPDQRLSELPPISWKPAVRPSVKEVEAQRLERSPSQKEFVAPRTPIEERLAGVWSEVLDVETVSVYDNFFELGGHSLLAAQVISRARKIFSAELPLRRIFETPTIAGLAEALYEMQTADTEDEELAVMLAELSQLSEEEAERRFAEEL
jgi:non-ribosomal peptide synthetase component F